MEDLTVDCNAVCDRGWELDFHIIGVGASAGGLEALEEFFRAVPENSGQAFVVIQHLSPDFKSHMEQLLTRQTTIPVQVVTNGVKVEPNHIYLIPAKMEMIVSNGRLLLSERSADRNLIHPIDQFFTSLASDAGNLSIAVILSGTGSDGARGIREIRKAGGLVFAQDDASAKFQGMPQSARSTGTVDFVLPPTEIVTTIMRYVKNNISRDQLREKESDEDHEVVAEGKIFEIIRGKYSIDFEQYKASTVGRRIRRRMVLQGIVDHHEYEEMLIHDSTEVDRLYEDLLIGVTEFFRDRKAFNILEAQVIERLVVERTEPLRVWVAACATGEEAYSVAMLLDEAFQRERQPKDFKIFATDVHSNSLQIASRGQYSEAAVSSISRERREKYFRPSAGGFQVTRELREAVVFAPHNVISDAPFTQMDLVCCRNMLIYLRPEVQDKALSMFHFALKPNGVLFLGPSESPGELSVDFKAIDKSWRLYSKLTNSRASLRVDFPLNRRTERRAFPSTYSFPARRTATLPNNFSVYERVLNKKLANSVLIDELGELIHVFAGAERYLKPRTGKASNRLLDTVHESLRSTLSIALQQAANEKKSTYCVNTTFSAGGMEEVLRIAVESIEGQDSEHHCVLVGFSKLGDLAKESDGRSSEQKEQDRTRLESLEIELQYSQENLQSVLEEMQSSNEELQASNEELVASNEELQSTNEELHSVNEELYTVNAEHQRRMEELSVANADMDNLLATTRVGVVFLDEKLLIRHYTPEIGRMLSLTDHDHGRHFEHFCSVLSAENLVDRLEDVLETKQEYEIKIYHNDGTPYLCRVLPYVSSSAAEGLVVTLIDITLISKAEEELKQKHIAMESALEAHRVVEEGKNAALKASEAKSAFLAMISHELRTPLTAMLGFAEMLREESDSVDYLEKVGTIQRNGVYLLRLLNDILDLSKIEAGRLRFKQDEIDIAETLKELARLMQVRAKQSQTSLSFKCSALLPKLIVGDEVRIRQIMVNLISNAIKFSMGKGVSVEAEMASNGDGRFVAVSVTDYGLGMSSEEIAGLFQPFSYSADVSLEEGNGLGLSICKRLAEGMDCKIEVQSAPQEGSRFTLLIPINEYQSTFSNIVPDELDETKSDISMQIDFPAINARILLADDRKDIGVVTKYFLEKCGAEVLIATDGLKAIQLAESCKDEGRPVAVILMDIQMPVMNGKVATRKLREMGYTIPIIAVTADAMDGEKEACLAMGCDGYFPKPINGRKLVQMVADLVNGKAELECA